MKRILTRMMLAAALVVLFSFSNRQDGAEHDIYSEAGYWYQDSCGVDTGKVDVVYFVSTNVLSAIDAKGQVSYRSTLTDDDIRVMDLELKYVRNRMFYNDFNFFAPHYHQYTFECISSYPEKIDSVRRVTRMEACEAFDHYYRYQNNGRPFVLAGFSQGAEMALAVLHHLTPQQRNNMVAAYIIGFTVTEEDLKDSAIRTATTETGYGEVVCFNTVLSAKGVWNFVAGGTKACINPVNWKTDSTPATFTYHGQEVTVHVDSTLHVLIADTDPTPFHQWMQAATPYTKAGANEDCLHHWDLLFYTRYIHDNALKRAQSR
ncbi:MAG: DUF3089 domain-containing protein [Prevotella sp.]